MGRKKRRMIRIKIKRFKKSEKIAVRKKEIKLRKNFLPILILTIMFWVLIGYIIFFVEPYSFLAIPLFFLTLFFATLFTFTIFFANTRRGFIAAMSTVLFLFLRYLGIGNVVNFLLILGLAITIEFYFSKK